MIFRAFLLALVALAAGMPSAVVAAPQLRSVQVSPSGTVLLARFSSNVASVKAGATYSRSTAARRSRCPTRRMTRASNSDWIWWPLGPKRVAELLDDKDATLTGAWGEPGRLQHRNSNPGIGSSPTLSSASRPIPPTRQLHEVRRRPTRSRCPRPGATGSRPGRLALRPRPDDRADLHRLRRPGRGRHVRRRHDEAPELGPGRQPGPLHDLGHVTLRDTALTVKVSNGATAGSLVTDAIYLELDLPPPVAPGDTVTFSAPEGTVTTAAGPVAAITSAPVAHTTDDVWFPYDATRKPTMAVGYNKTFDQYYFGSRIYADRWPATAGWQPASRARSARTTGRPDRGLGDGRRRPLGGDRGGGRLRNWPNAPLSGTAVFRFHNPGGAADPGCTLGNTRGRATPSGRGCGRASPTPTGSTRSGSRSRARTSCRSGRPPSPTRSRTPSRCRSTRLEGHHGSRGLHRGGDAGYPLPHDPPGRRRAVQGPRLRRPPVPRLDGGQQPQHGRVRGLDPAGVPGSGGGTRPRSRRPCPGGRRRPRLDRARRRRRHGAVVPQGQRRGVGEGDDGGAARAGHRPASRVPRPEVARHLRPGVRRQHPGRVEGLSGSPPVRRHRADDAADPGLLPRRGPVPDRGDRDPGRRTP
jgi:hypothetical protein